MEEPDHPALTRILESADAAAALQAIGLGLAGADTTSLLLEAMRQRSQKVNTNDVLAQYQSDRFVRPPQVGAIAMARLQLQTLEAIEPAFTAVELAPLVPLGTHALSGVDQNNVVTTVRLNEVAADPTNSLTLEAAVRRKALLAQDPKSASVVRLGAVQRVVRAQRFSGPISFAHFALLGLVSSGRDRGSRAFETEALTDVLQAIVAAIGNSTGGEIHIDLSDFDGSFTPVMESSPKL